MGARRELGAEIEDQVVEAFLARVEQRINLQVDRRVAQTSGATPRGQGTKPVGVELVAAPLALAIPLVAIAGGTVGVWGVIAVMAAVALIVTLTFVDR